MGVFIVWKSSLTGDSKDFYGCFSTEERAQEWINNNLDSQDKEKPVYIEQHHVN